MKVEVTEVAPCRKRVAVEVPPERVNQAFDEAYNTLRGSVQVKGFRKGHAPRKLLERKFGKHVHGEVVSKLFQESFVKAMEENELNPMGDPDIDVEALEVKANTPFAYETEVDVRPAFELPDFKGLKLIERYVKAGDDEVDERLNQIREAFAHPLLVEDAAKAGDVLVAIVEMTCGDEVLVEESEQRLRLEGERLYGVKVESVADLLAGIKAGEEKTLELPLPEDYFREALRGQTATLKLAAESVQRPQLPELDDAFAERMGLKTMEEVRERIRDSIEGERRAPARQAMEMQAVDQLIAATSFDLPEAFLKRQVDNAVEERLRMLGDLGEEEAAARRAEIEAESRENMERAVRRMVLYEAIAEKEAVEITQEDVQEHIGRLAMAYRTTPEAMMRRIQEMNGISMVAREIRDLKVTSLLIDNAEVTHEEPKAKAADAADAAETAAAPEAPAEGAE